MILGKTKEQKYKEFREWREKETGTEHTSFAYFPIRLNDGRWVFLRKYKWKYDFSDNWFTDYRYRRILGTIAYL